MAAILRTATVTAVPRLLQRCRSIAPSTRYTSILDFSSNFLTTTTSVTSAYATAATASSVLRHSLRTTRSFCHYSISDRPFVMKLEGPPERFQKRKLQHQTAGPRNVLEVDDMANGDTLVRITIPGVGVNGMRVWTAENVILFSGEGEKEIETDNITRKYSGSFKISPELHPDEKVTAKMANGVLLIELPGQRSLVKVEGPIRRKKMLNPFQYDGIDIEDETKMTMDAEGITIVTRIMMPGVPGTGAKIWVDEERVHFSGTGEKEYPGEESGRNYEGSFSFQADPVFETTYNAIMVNGVLVFTKRSQIRME